MHIALLLDHCRRRSAIDIAARPLAPDDNIIIALSGAHADHPTRTAMDGDARATLTLTNGGSTCSGGFSPSFDRAIAGLTCRGAAFLRSPLDRRCTAFAGPPAAALAGPSGSPR